jgi:hypothetical protein
MDLASRMPTVPAHQRAPAVSWRRLRPPVQGIRALARLNFDEDLHKLKRLRLREACQCIALGVQTKSRTSLASCADPDVADEFFWGVWAPFGVFVVDLRKCRSNTIPTIRI